MTILEIRAENRGSTGDGLVFDHHGRIEELIQTGKQRRPDIPWNSITDEITNPNNQNKGEDL